MRIVIGSAGRRVYLVRWFQEAMRRAGFDGQVYVLENDKNAASIAFADGFRHLPRYDESEYRRVLLAAIHEIRPHLFISLNDYELTGLAGGIAQEIRDFGVVVPSLSAEAHRAVADKYAMWKTLTRAGIKTPSTALLSDLEDVESILSETQQVILKDRFGSGSSGLRRVDGRDLKRWLHQRQSSQHGLGMGTINPKYLVIQPELHGEEFGLDVVTPLEGGTVAGVLARRKLVMRNGETNVAETVESAEFQELASGLAAAFDTQGLIDVDVIQTAQGECQVIDINPRFGGGYPFNHVAGADVPSYYVASVMGTDLGFQWSEYQSGHRAAKYEEVVDFLNY